MENSKWLDRYKDPRWQKKRLEILQRDNWKCKICECNDETLHVHHNWYEKDLELWEYSDNCYETLCEECHGVLHDVIISNLSNIRKILYTSNISNKTIFSLITHLKENDKYTKILINTINCLDNDRHLENKLRKDSEDLEWA